MFSHRLNHLPYIFGVLFTLLAVPSATGAVRFGFTGGLSFADEEITINGGTLGLDGIAPSFTIGQRVGPSFGVLAEGTLSSVFAVRGQLQYVPKGYQTKNIVITTPEFPNGIGTAELKHRIDYLSIPVVLKAKPDLGWSFAPYILAGPRLDIKVGESTGDVGFTEADKSATFGFSFGGGFDYALANGGTVIIEAVYALDAADSGENIIYTSRNKSFLIQVGYLLK